MRLKSCELLGFKSFARKTELKFDDPVTAIVGPNGSGKSNVAEAFRFVLGEQSIKSLRGAKGEDLIFNGTGETSRSNRASVKVSFDNSDHSLNVDYGDVVIERIVHRDGANEYRLNGSSVRLKDILELLAGANIGPGAHHVISQGEADKMLESSPLERYSMIEDALGLKVYEYKITESERKISKTGENIKEVKALRRELAPHIKYLKKQVNRIEKARDLRASLRDEYINYLKRESVYIDIVGRESAEEVLKLEEDLSQKESEFEKVKNFLESEKEDSDINQPLAVDEEISELQNRKSDFSRKLGSIEGEISSYERIIESGEKTTERVESIAKKDLEDFQKEVRPTFEKGLDADNIEDVKNSLRRLFEALSEFVKNPKRIFNEEATSGVNIARVEIEKLSDKRKELERELNKLNERERELIREKNQILSERERVLNAQRQQERSYYELKSSCEEVKHKLGIARSKKETVERDRVRFTEELKEAGILIGSSILDYKSFEVEDSGGRKLEESEIVYENRDLQEDRRRSIERKKIKLEDMQVVGSDDVIKEYSDTSERDEFLRKELIDMENSVQKLVDIKAELEEKLSKTFNEGLENINKEFQNFFSVMFGGGQVYLETVEVVKKKRAEEEKDEIDTGIEIRVSFPRKSIKGLRMLSGGERALTSIALVFAMSQVNPPPFIILDETDAALDETNSRKYGELIEHLSGRSQLILITHNRETMNRADALYGITMSKDGISKILSVKLSERAVIKN